MEKTYKRSYSLKESTIRKLDEMKLYSYPIGTTLEEIVEDAICYLYKEKREKELPPK